MQNSKGKPKYDCKKVHPLVMLTVGILVCLAATYFLQANPQVSWLRYEWKQLAVSLYEYASTYLLCAGLAAITLAIYCRKRRIGLRQLTLLTALAFEDLINYPS